MKRFLSILSLVIIGFVSTSCYDDMELRESIEDLEGRVTTLETLCTELNSNITALNTLVQAMQKGDYVVSVSPLKNDEGVEIGYRIIFKESGVVDLYHGADGKDGVDGTDGTDGTNGTDGKDGHDGETPVIGAQVGEDGIYYWTLNGEFVVDAEGNNIPLTAPAPKVKVEEEKWFVSYDNGKTWIELGPAVTVGIKDVEYTDDVLVLTMNDGTKINVKIGSGFKVVLGEFDVKTLNYGSDLVIPYTIEGAEGEVVVFLLKDGEGFAIELVEETATTGKVTISQQDAAVQEVAGKVGIFAVGEDGTTVSQAVRFNSGVLVSVEANKEVYEVEAAGGKVNFTVSTNVAFEVTVGAEWITYVETKAVEEKTLTFAVAANEGEDREAEVKITSGKVELGFKVAQAGGYEADPVETLVGMYKIQQFWLYGGSAPDKGKSQWLDLHNKTWWFDQDGHGIKAELNNYLEFTLDGFNADKTQSSGKCINWAGTDGKNWSCWYHHTKINNGTPTDGNKFYRQIPIGESTWVRDYTVTPNTVTFTHADGEKTVLEIFNPGDKFTPNYGESNPSSMTREFPRTSGNDLDFHAVLKGEPNADFLGQEIDLVYYCPRDIFIEVDRVDEIPAEAKTSEPKFTPVIPEPEEPEVPEAGATLAGTYKYSQAHTFGGVNGNVAAVSIVEKYTSWYPSVNNMTDDVYTFTATGKDANGNETGTLTFTPGENGTWDYKIKDPNGNIYDATDLYGYIGHNNPTTYVYDAENKTVTFTTDGKETVARFLPAGDNTFEAYGKTLTVSSTFALSFDMGYTEARETVSDQYGNFARFYAYARAYVLHLQKQ